MVLLCLQSCWSCEALAGFWVLWLCSCLCCCVRCVGLCRLVRGWGTFTSLVLDPDFMCFTSGKLFQSYSGAREIQLPVSFIHCQGLGVGCAHSYALYGVQMRWFFGLYILTVFTSLSCHSPFWYRELGNTFVIALLQPRLSTQQHTRAGSFLFHLCWEILQLCVLQLFIRWNGHLSTHVSLCSVLRSELSPAYVKECILFQWDLLSEQVLVAWMEHVLTEIVTITWLSALEIFYFFPPFLIFCFPGGGHC